MKKILIYGFAALASLLLVVGGSSADSLELRDGRVLKGSYQGGTQNTVRFLTDGQTEVFSTSDILALTFDRPAPTPAPAPESAPAPVAETPSASPARAVSAQAPATPAGDRITVPAGTSLLVRMIDSVDSDKNRVGDRFHASLETNLEVEGVVIAKKGADVYGRLAEAKSAGRVSGKSQLQLELTDIVLNGRTYPILTSDYEVAGASRGATTAKRTVGGAALGAIIGAIAGGGKGAAIGAGAGAAAGTGITLITKGEQVKVPSETLLEFRLQQPVSLPAQQ